MAHRPFGKAGEAGTVATTHLLGPMQEIRGDDGTGAPGTFPSRRVPGFCVCQLANRLPATRGWADIVSLNIVNLVFMKRHFIISAFFAFAAASLPMRAHALQYFFTYTFDGASASLELGSDLPTATSLQPGDELLIRVSASGDDYWQVEAPLSSFLYASYFTSASATRTFNSLETLILDGMTVNTRERLANGQSFVHFGGDSNGPASLFAVGQKFDVYQNVYKLLDAESSATQASSDQLAEPFYNSIAYKQRSESVPGPLPVLGLGAAFAYSRKLRRKLSRGRAQ